MKYRANSDRVRAARERQGLTQMSLAIAAGVDLRTVQRLEVGAHAQHARVANAIAEALGVRLDDCFVAHASDGTATRAGRDQTPDGDPTPVKKRAAVTTNGG